MAVIDTADVVDIASRHLIGYLADPVPAVVFIADLRIRRSGIAPVIGSGQEMSQRIVGEALRIGPCKHAAFRKVFRLLGEPSAGVIAVFRLLNDLLLIILQALLAHPSLGVVGVGDRGSFGF